MNKRFFLPLALLSCKALYPMGFEHMRELFEEMDKVHKKIEQQIFSSFNDHTQQIKNQSKVSLKINEQPEAHKVEVVVEGVQIKGEKPDASLAIDQDQSKVTLEVPLHNGTINIDAQNTLSDRSILSVNLSLKSDQTNGTQPINQQRFAQSFNRTEMVKSGVDLTKLPTISFDKEKNQLSIALGMQESGKQQSKTTIPIEIK